VTLALSLALALGALLLALAVRVHLFARAAHEAPRAEAIVVLGAKLFEGGRPSPAFEGRIERAAELFAAGAAPLVLFSGGGTPSEASAGRAYAHTLGVAESACVVEEQSSNTFENARFSATLLEARGIRRVVVVTDGFHLLRAVRLFRLHGLEPIPAASRRRLTTRTWLLATLKEALAYLRVPLQRR
jgi:uncharacterized SAM-binding protein YcdF (DUF218 family)